MLKFYQNFAIFRFIRCIPKPKLNEILRIGRQYSVKLYVSPISHLLYISNKLELKSFAHRKRNHIIYISFKVIAFLKRAAFDWQQFIIIVVLNQNNTCFAILLLNLN
jgi:hypothetical protein